MVSGALRPGLSRRVGGYSSQKGGNSIPGGRSVISCPSSFAGRHKPLINRCGRMKNTFRLCRLPNSSGILRWSFRLMSLPK